jgi:ATP-binding protein involved in chromosome partitioning
MPSHTSPFQRAEHPVPPPTDPQVEVKELEVKSLLKTVIEPILDMDIVSLGMVRNLRIVDDYVYLRLYVGKHQFALKAQIMEMLGLAQEDVKVIDTATGQRFIPLEAHGIKVMSVGLLAAPDHPLAWRGPVLHKIITQFIQEVEWGDLDYLLIDLPPGTGDAQITIVQESPICGVILVTTPQQVAVADVRRSIHMFRRVGIPVLGIIENMSYLLCGHCGTPNPIFGSGGGQQLADELQAPLLGQVPIDAKICTGGDIGTPLTLSDPNSAVAEVFTKIAIALDNSFAPYHQIKLPQESVLVP